MGDIMKMTNNEILKKNLIEMIVGLYFALEFRNDCPNCGGKGGQYVSFGDDVEYEGCECVKDADTVLQMYQKDFKVIINEYLKMNNIGPDEIAKKFELAYGIFDHLMAKMEEGR